MNPGAGNVIKKFVKIIVKKNVSASKLIYTLVKKDILPGIPPAI
jgi:hypothetical protein